MCLQAVDYVLWAVQRFYEVRRHEVTGQSLREERFLRLLWPQIDEILDLDFGPAGNSVFDARHPLLLEERFDGGADEGEVSRA